MFFLQNCILALELIVSITKFVSNSDLIIKLFCMLLSEKIQIFLIFAVTFHEALLV